MDRKITKDEIVSFIIIESEVEDLPIGDIIKIKAIEITDYYESDSKVYGLYYDGTFDCWIEGFIAKFINEWNYKVIIEELK